jgi:TetR/AcrR family transcriptional regulator, regulator of cefoperazone and chloramphenicol sensitivity
MSTAVSHYRPVAQQRGEETRARILDAALELFAASGFEGASTRIIAERADVNLPAIQYYFGSKEGLYRAVVDQFSQQMKAGVAPIAEHIRKELAAGQPSRRKLTDLLCDMLDVIIALILDDSVPNRECRQKFFARMEVEPNPAFDALQEEMVRHVCQPCCDIIGRLIDRPPDDEKVLLLSMTLVGQAKIFCGWGTNRLLHWETIGEVRIAAAQSVIRENIQAIFRTARSR